jgi:hypothetical protein
MIGQPNLALAYPLESRLFRRLEPNLETVNISEHAQNRAIHSVGTHDELLSRFPLLPGSWDDVL